MEAEDKKGDVVKSEEEERPRTEVEDLKRLVDEQAAEVGKLKKQEEMLRGKCKRRDEWIVGLEEEIEKIRDYYQEVVEVHSQRITGLEQEIEKMRDSHQEIVEEHTQRIAGLEQEIEKMRGSHQKVVEWHTRRSQAMEDRMKETEELSITRSTELSGAQVFSPTTDRLSEAEVLNIVRDLNENIYQVAVNLTEEWEKLRPPKATGRVDPGPRAPVSVLARLARDRDPTALTFLLQSRLCSRAVDMTLSWFRRKELAILVSIY
jgi:hypothetical protein